MPAVDQLLAEAGLTPADLTALAVDVGPGSFTGVRIGVCHGNAMAMALGLPIVAVNALEALAFPLLGGSGPVAAIIDARNGNGYGALYAPDGTALILWTCRQGKQLEAAVSWCKKQGLTFNTVNQNLKERIRAFHGDTRKISADIYIEDRAAIFTFGEKLELGGGG